MQPDADELVFVPLGGLGEIGMNAALYGFGPEGRRRWILVDCGMGFASEEHLPGVDLMYPDLRFVEEERRNLLGILITHAHEDHIGALAELWPRLRAPVFATRFAIGLLETRRLSEPGAPRIELREVAAGQRLALGPFDVEYVPVAHSIPESHAHEDHIGALAELWPRLRAPVFATRFAIGLLETRRLSEPGAPRVELREVAAGQRLALGPFDVEYVPVAHSIPESHALAIRTPHGLVLHTGDWKLDDTPFLGHTTSASLFGALGDEGVLALVCDSTNAIRDGRSASETEVARRLAEIIAAAPHRVAVTTFASNVARLRAVAEAARSCGREIVVVGRAMDRTLQVAAECGYLDGLPPFRRPETYGYLPRDKVVALLTGSQGEPRAALARIAQDNHPEIALSPGDRVIFSSRVIPGNEREVGEIVNNLVRRGIEVVTSETDLVHVSGHPRRGELAEMYRWTRPRIAVPAHGEDLHLAEHAAFARAQGVPAVVKARNGTVVRLAPGAPAIVDDVPTGRLYRDGDIVVGAGDRAIPERRRLAFAGVVSVAIAIDKRGEIVGEPVVDAMGLPGTTREGEPLLQLVADTVGQLLDGLSRAKRRDSEAVENAVARGVRSAVQTVWGKKPACHVLVVEV